MSNGNLIRVNGPSAGHGWKRPVVVCGVHRIGKCRNGPDADRLALANALLIAAAPDLLEALQEIERHCDARGLTAVRGMARAAIAKATGAA